ncbi:NmrA-like protein [Coleophoma crateriformis]|uniref:NmrA-like protein n=1 Tax=Coleophoma crateriformis TaxID=565419 RepID=A0A3D8QBH4_9HELO|nr:NmrA-like protein [Coleophoma crateriformis]
MLVLITGMTGMVGRPMVEAALARGHSVRGMGRDRNKVPESTLERLESFVQCTSIYDLPALDRAVEGVDAIVNANTYAAEVVLDGQLLLLRAAERAGVKIFHAASWNFDWSKDTLGNHEGYDPFLCFANQVRLTSSIRPLYMFTGAIVEFFYDNPRGSAWDPKTKTMSYFGDGSKKFNFTTANDLAAYTIEAISTPEADQGGFVRVESFRATWGDLVTEYEAARGGTVKAQLKCFGSEADVEGMLATARKTIPAREYEKYIGLSYVLNMLRDTWDYEPIDCKRFSGVKQTTLREWLKDHPEL